MFAGNMNEEHYVPDDEFTEKQEEIKVKITELLDEVRDAPETNYALAQQIF